jgi:hypothetical protein
VRRTRYRVAISKGRQESDRTRRPIQPFRIARPALV